MKKLVICACRKYKKIPQDLRNEAIKTATEAGEILFAATL